MLLSWIAFKLGNVRAQRIEHTLYVHVRNIAYDSILINYNYLCREEKTGIGLPVREEYFLFLCTMDQSQVDSKNLVDLRNF